MGDPKGFLTTPRELPVRRPVDLRLRDWREVYEDFPRTDLEAQAGRCMNCGIPFCHQGCPLGNLIPEWNDLVYRHDWREATERLHATNNFPEFTGTPLPRPVRGRVRAGDQLRRRHDQAGRDRDHRPGVGRGLGAAAEGGDPHGQEGGGGRLRPGRAGGGPAAHPRRARRGGVRARRPHRRAAALRHPRVQDGEGPARPAPGPDARRGHDLQGVGRRRHRRHGRAAPQRVRRGRARGRGHRVARPARARPGSQGRLPGDGVPAVGQPRAAGRHRRTAHLAPRASTS